MCLSKINLNVHNRGIQKNQKTEKTGKKNNRKNRTVKKNWLKRLKFWKNQTEPEPKKTEPNRKIKPKSSHTGLNRFLF